MNGPDGTTRKRITVKDVARAAGVSPGTVSNAISGKRKVDSETRARASGRSGAPARARGSDACRALNY